MQSHEIASSVDGFVIHERIGRGGSAVVYRATQTAFNREVALKAIHLGGHNIRFLDRFAREARLIASLEHTSIVVVRS